jgi:hypothetical protein
MLLINGKRSLISRKETSMAGSSLDMSVEEGVRCGIGDDDGERANVVVVEWWWRETRRLKFRFGVVARGLDRYGGWRMAVYA